MLGTYPKLLSDVLPTLNATTLLSKVERWLLRWLKRTASVSW